MNRRFHRWFDQQSEPGRFYIFITTMAVLLFAPSVAWLVLYDTQYQLELVHVNLIQVALLLPLLISRMMYVRRSRNGKQRE